MKVILNKVVIKENTEKNTIYRNIDGVHYHTFAARNDGRIKTTSSISTTDYVYVAQLLELCQWSLLFIQLVVNYHHKGIN
jgi:hypothetical protein